MEIIKNGKLQQYECECSKCSTIFRFGNNDITVVCITPLTNPRYLKCVECPICGKIYFKKG